MKRSVDRVEIQIVGDEAGALTNFTSLAITLDITAPSEASFELGDNGTWPTIRQQIEHGTKYRIFVNNKIYLTGRVEHNDIPLDVMAGAAPRFTVRTKLADAIYSTARTDVRVKDTSIRDFILKLYEPLGYTEDDFILAPYTSRDLITGKDSSGKGSPIATDLEKIKIKEARVSPSETVYDAADRHLRRHGLMHWDSPDGRIVISAPNDEQDAIYSLLSNSNPRRRYFNNVEQMTFMRDWSGIPSTMAVFGSSWRNGESRRRVGAFAIDFDLQAAGFVRPVSIVAEGVRTLDLAERTAQRELSARSKSKDGVEAQLDGLSYYDGNVSVPWSTDTTCVVDSDVVGGNQGVYYIHRVVLTRSAQAGDTANLSCLKRGIWKL